MNCRACYVGNIPKRATPVKLIDQFELDPDRVKIFIFHNKGATQSYAIIISDDLSAVISSMTLECNSQFIFRTLNVVDQTVDLNMSSTRADIIRALGLNTALRWSCGARTFHPAIALFDGARDAHSAENSDLGYGDDGCLQLRMWDAEDPGSTTSSNSDDEFETEILWVTVSDGDWNGQSLFEVFTQLGISIVRALVYHHDKYSGPPLGLVQLKSQVAAEELWLKGSIRFKEVVFRFGKSRTESMDTAWEVSKTKCSVFPIVKYGSTSQPRQPELALQSLAIRSSEYVLATATDYFSMVQQVAVEPQPSNSEVKSSPSTVVTDLDVADHEEHYKNQQSHSELWQSSNASYLESMWNSLRSHEEIHAVESAIKIRRPSVNMVEYASQQIECGEVVAPMSHTVIVDEIDGRVNNCQGDLRELFSRFGNVSQTDFVNTGNQCYRAYIRFAQSSEALIAAKALHLIKFGERTFTTHLA